MNLCLSVSQWWIVVGLSQRTTLSCCQSQEPHMAVWPHSPVTKVLYGQEETTGLCVELKDSGEDLLWSVKVTQSYHYANTTLLSVTMYFDYLCIINYH